MKEIINKIIKNKKIYIYGNNKYQTDFEYIFDMLDINGYIIDDVSLSKVKSNEEFIIVCSFEKKEILDKMNKFGLLYNENFIFAEDLFYLLDDFREDIVNNRKIAVWGTGETCENLKEQITLNKYDVDIELYIDGDKKKNGSVYDDIDVKHISFLKNNIKEYFIIVASVFYCDIKPQLEELGLKEKVDFLPYSVFLSKPSAMIKEAIRSQPIEGIACNRPFSWFYYAWFGTYCCCSTWVKYPIGNPIAEKPEESWNSIVAKLYRLSMINKTFCFCKKDVCSYIGRTGNKNDLIIPRNWEKPSVLTLGIDYTCNLRCSSCREEIKIAKGSQLKLRENMAKKIIDTGWLANVEKLELSGSGEVLFSKVYEPILYDFNTTKRESISLLTNGTLLNKEKWNKLKLVYKKIDVNISIDAATEETYNKIRRGGHWRNLMKNLEMLSDIKKSGELNYIEIRMVVQKENYKEMVQFVELGKRIGVDRVVFTKILNWDLYSDVEFEKVSMISSDGVIKEELREILENPIFKDEVVVLNEFKKYMEK